MLHCNNTSAVVDISRQLTFISFKGFFFSHQKMVPMITLNQNFSFPTYKRILSLLHFHIVSLVISLGSLKLARDVMIKTFSRWKLEFYLFRLLVVLTSEPHAE